MSINVCRNLLDSPDMRTELIYISSNYNYSFLPLLIEGLEKRNLHISESLSMIEKAYINISNSQGDIRKAIEVKFISIIKKNINLKILQEIAKIIDGSDKIVSDNVKKLSNHEISCFKFAPVTSCNVERTFSQYKNLLRLNRHQIKNENLPFYTIPYCNTWDE